MSAKAAIKSLYPEHEKLARVKDASQAIGQFLDALPSLRLHLCELSTERDEFYPAFRSIESILAEYFEIDLKKIEAEKRQMIDALRKMNQVTK